MVVCKYCKDERVVSRTLTLSPLKDSKLDYADDTNSDPSMLSITFRCMRCNTVYTFSRVLTSDELKEKKQIPSDPNAKGGCGGCGG